MTVISGRCLHTDPVKISNAANTSQYNDMPYYLRCTTQVKTWSKTLRSAMRVLRPFKSFCQLCIGWHIISSTIAIHFDNLIHSVSDRYNDHQCHTYFRQMQTELLFNLWQQGSFSRLHCVMSRNTMVFGNTMASLLPECVSFRPFSATWPTSRSWEEVRFAPNSNT